MFLNFKFCILKAYAISLKTNYKHVLFYLLWYAIVWLLSLAVLFGLGVYTHILDFSVMTQNYSWIISSIKHQLVSFFLGINYKGIKITEFSLHQLLQFFVSKDILNPAIATMSVKEYFNIILLPKKMILVPAFMLYTSFLMTVSIGYIKTALKFQNDKKATLYDMYQYIYLLPQYWLGKIILFLFSCIPVVFAILIVFLIFSLFPSYTLLQQTSILAILLAIIFIFLLITFISFIYQRLRFIKYFIIDKEVTAFKACKLSWDLTKGNVMALSVFSLIATLVMIAHPMSGLFILLASWLNQQAEVSVYKQMLE